MDVEGASNKKQIIFSKIILVAVSFLFLLILSELAHQSGNKDSQIFLLLNLSKISANTSEYNLSLNFLRKASKIKIGLVDKKYPDIDFSKEITVPETKNRQFIDNYLSNIKTLDVLELTQDNPAKWGKIFYALGLDAYHSGDYQLVAPFFQYATSLAPEWSYFQVELANYYFSINESPKAEDQLNFCLRFEYPKEHCNQYIQENLETQTSLPVGHWQKEINGI